MADPNSHDAAARTPQSGMAWSSRKSDRPALGIEEHDSVSEMRYFGEDLISKMAACGSPQIGRSVRPTLTRRGMRP